MQTIKLKIKKTKSFFKLQWENKRFLNNDKKWFTIIEYSNWHKVFVQFDGENELVLTTIDKIRGGYVK